MTFDLKMKKTGIYLLATCVIAIAGVYFVKKAQWLHAYNQAEPFVQLVWPLAADMKAYYLEHGSNACALTDVTSDPEMQVLTKYHPIFTPDGTNIFTLTVNDSYGFGISSDFTPHWIYQKK